VLSGGMDGRLWLWPAAGSTGYEIQSAHAAPVSKVACLTPAAAAAGIGTSGSRSSVGARSKPAAAASAAGPVLAASCSYDRTVKVWDVSGSRGKQLAVLQGHAGPVLELAVHPACGCIVTGAQVLRHGIAWFQNRKQDELLIVYG
jgi:WD40 repeat protein